MKITKKTGIVIGIIFVSFLAFLDLFLFIYYNSSDLPTGADQWGYFTPLYEQSGFLKGFFYQQGSHFLGAGYISSLFTGIFSGFYAGAEGYSVMLWMAVNTLLALSLKWKIFKELSWYDLFIPLVFLNSKYSILYLNYAHASVTAFPVMSVFLLAHLSLMRSGFRKILGLALLFFFSLFTGYAFITSALIALYTVYLFFKSGGRVISLWSLLVFEAIVVSLFLNLYNFSLQEIEVDTSQVKVSYGMYAFNLLRSFFVSGLDSDWILGLLSIPVVYLIFKVNRRTFPLQVIFLMGFSLLYLVLNTQARAFLGPEQAFALRYGPFFIPGFTGVYFLLSYPVRRSIALQHFSLLILVSVFLFFRLREDKIHEVPVLRRNSAVKAWYECYEEYRDVNYCTKKNDIPPLTDNVDVKIVKFRELQKTGTRFF